MIVVESLFGRLGLQNPSINRAIYVYILPFAFHFPCRFPFDSPLLGPASPQRPYTIPLISLFPRISSLLYKDGLLELDFLCEGPKGKIRLRVWGLV